MPSAYFNPADHLLDLVSIDSRKGKYEESRHRVEGLIEGWRGYKGKTDIEEEGTVGMGSGTEKGTSGSKEGADIKREKKSTGMIVALPVVLERHWKNLWRQKEVRPSAFCHFVPSSYT